MYNLTKLLLSLALLCGLCGCGTLQRGAADAGLAGGGALIGSKLTKNKPMGALAGAAGGIVISKVAQSQADKAAAESYQRGYDDGRNQAVKQCYWTLQNLHKPETCATHGKVVPVRFPEQTINGVTIKERTEYIRVE